MGYRLPKNGIRNRAIYDAYLAGEKAAQLAPKYGLAVETVAQIICAERLLASFRRVQQTNNNITSQL